MPVTGHGRMYSWASIRGQSEGHFKLSKASFFFVKSISFSSYDRLHSVVAI